MIIIRFFAYIIICIALVSISEDARAEKDADKTQSLAPPLPFLLQNSHLGTEFWIALPQNEVEGVLIEEGLEILVTAIEDTKVTLDVPGFGVSRSKNVEAFQPAVFSSNDGDIQFTWVVKESEEKTFKGIHITSGALVSVFVINVKFWSSEGFMAIPWHACGTKYIHCSYYDDHENNRDRGGGFIIVAGESNTNVNIKLNGEGLGVAKTAGGHDIGDQFNVPLSAGAAYMVKGDGKTYGQFDLTGSIITSNKPIGVVSFHTRCPMPSNPAQDLYRDNLAEMLAPVDRWGTFFVSTQFTRTKNGDRQGDGDNFRVVASEPQTTVKCKYYDISDASLIKQPQIKLSKAGDFWEPFDIKSIDRWENTLESIRGVSVWTADKPIQLMQYAWSGQWDGDWNWDPLMILIPPVEQYVPNLIFQTPSPELKFSTNELNLFAVGDPDDPESTLLKSITIDGEEFFKKNSKLLSNNIPGTDIYWAKVIVEKGTHTIQSKTKVSGYLAGFRRYYSYGWPIGFATNKIDEYDDQAPTLTISGECGEYTIKADEFSNGAPNPDQIDQGICKVIIFDMDTYNYNADYPNELNPHIKSPSYTFNLIPQDKALPGFAKFAVMDRAGNLVVDSVMYTPDSIALDVESLDFAEVRVGTSGKLEIGVENIGAVTVDISALSLVKNTVFTFVDENIVDGFTLQPGETAFIGFKYQPEAEMTEDPDIDTLYIQAVCSEFKVQLSGEGVMPHIASEGHDFGDIEAKTEICIEDQDKDGLRIGNPGKDTLKVTSIENIAAPFFITNAAPEFPFEILPGEEIYFKSVCFFPEDSIDYSLDITIKSDAAEGDVSITLLGRGFIEDTTGIIDTWDGLAPEMSAAPNPAFSGVVKIEYAINAFGIIEIGLFDLNGILIKNIVSGFAEKGPHEKNFSTTGINSGVYYLRMVFGGHILTKRLALIK